jgi:surface carbohydrate biosynthesis protein
MKNINLLLPIESISRELDYKLFLAVSLASKNINVIVAQHDYFNSQTSGFKGGAYIGKNIFKSLFPISLNEPDVDLCFLNELRSNEISAFHLDEEGAIFAGDEEDWKVELDARLNPCVLNENDYVFTWGKFQKKYYQNKNSLVKGPNIVGIGHPKYDLCKPRFRRYYQEEIDEIKAEYGSFILVNTNLDIANGLLGLKGTFSDYGQGWLHYSSDDDQQRIKFMDWWSHQCKVLSNFVALLHKLSIVFSDRTFVVRPHPGENHEYYETVFSGVKNIHVNKTGAVHPWIMSADLVIHDGCTTAIESYLAGVPIVNYKSVENEQFDIKLPNQFGIKCKSDDDVIKVINDLNRDPESLVGKNSLIPSTRSLMRNLEEEVFDEFILLVNKLMKEKWGRNDCEGGISISSMRIREYRYSLELFLRKMVRIFFPLKRVLFSAAKKHFPGFNRHLVVRKMNIAKLIMNKQVSLDYLSDRLFVISSEDRDKW